REVSREWVKRNPEKQHAMSRRWRKEHPVRHKQQLIRAGMRRRERKRSVETCDPQSLSILQQLIAASVKLRCGVCSKNMSKRDRTIDHIVPLVRGGTGHIGNLQVVHKRCNSRKHAKMPEAIDGQHQMNFAGRGDTRPLREWERADP